jgi:hypothetical protein
MSAGLENADGTAVTEFARPSGMWVGGDLVIRQFGTGGPKTVAVVVPCPGAG